VFVYVCAHVHVFAYVHESTRVSHNLYRNQPSSIASTHTYLQSSSSKAFGSACSCMQSTAFPLVNNCWGVPRTGLAGNLVSHTASQSATITAARGSLSKDLVKCLKAYSTAAAAAAAAAAGSLTLSPHRYGTTTTSRNSSQEGTATGVFASIHIIVLGSLGYTVHAVTRYGDT